MKKISIRIVDNKVWVNSTNPKPSSTVDIFNIYSIIFDVLSRCVPSGTSMHMSVDGIVFRNLDRRFFRNLEKADLGIVSVA